MTDIKKITEKVIKGLECCTADLGTDFCAACPYKDKDPVTQSCFNKYELMHDALVLLKKQAAQLKEWEKYTNFLAAHGMLGEMK